MQGRRRSISQSLICTSPDFQFPRRYIERPSSLEFRWSFPNYPTAELSRENAGRSYVVAADLLWGGQLSRIPASAQSLNQLDACDHLLRSKIHRSFLIIEQRSLRDDNVEVWVDTRLITHVCFSQAPGRSFDGAVLLLNGDSKNSYGYKVVFNLLKGAQHSFTVIRYVLLVVVLELLDGGSTKTCIEDRFRKLRSYRPKTTRPRKPAREGRSAQPARRA